MLAVNHLLPSVAAANRRARGRRGGQVGLQRVHHTLPEPKFKDNLGKASVLSYDVSEQLDRMYRDRIRGGQ
jgi:hypothetical protein